MTNITLPDGWEYKTIMLNEYYKAECGVCVVNKALNKRQAILVSSPDVEVTKEYAVSKALPELIEWIKTSS